MKEPNAPPRYGEALLNVAEGQGAVEEILDGTRAIRGVIREQPRLLAFLNVPQVSAEQKKGVVRRVFESKLHPVLLNFLCLLVDRQRSEDLIEVFDSFELAWDIRRGIHPVEIRTAIPMPDDLKGGIAGKLEEMSGGEVRVTYVTDPAIIGGAVVLFGDTGTDLDGSIRRGLEKIKESLLKVSVR